MKDLSVVLDITVHLPYSPKGWRRLVRVKTCTVSFKECLQQTEGGLLKLYTERSVPGDHLPANKTQNEISKLNVDISNKLN